MVYYGGILSYDFSRRCYEHEDPNAELQTLFAHLVSKACRVAGQMPQMPEPLLEQRAYQAQGQTKGGLK